MKKDRSVEKGDRGIRNRREDFEDSIINIGTLKPACFDDAHGIAKKFHTAVAAKTDSLLLFSFVLTKCSFRKVVCVVDFRMCQEKQVIIPVGSHSFEEIEPIPVIFTRRRILIFGVPKFQYRIVSAIIGFNQCIRKTCSVLLCFMDHGRQELFHLRIP